jgi:hypothetical protein
MLCSKYQEGKTSLQCARCALTKHLPQYLAQPLPGSESNHDSHNHSTSKKCFDTQSTDRDSQRSIPWREADDNDIRQGNHFIVTVFFFIYRDKKRPTIVEVFFFPFYSCSPA